MSAHPYDELTRRTAATVTRRHSFLTLGGAALATASVPAAEVAAGKAGKQARRRCQRQRGACRANVTEACGAGQQCLDNLLPCCEPLATCDAGAATDCFLGFLVN